MADKIGEIYVDIEARVGKLEKELKTAEKATEQTSKKMGSSLGNIAKTAGIVVGAFMAFRKVTAVLKDLTATARVQEQAFRLIAGQIEATGNAAGFTATELQRLAGQIQSVSNFGDEQIMKEAISSMLKFQNVTGETFERAIRLSADMASVTGGLANASQMLGRSLEDPLQALTLLRRQGIFFNQQQQELIKGFVESGQAAKAQEVILNQLESTFGGMAKRMAEPVIQLKNLYGDLKEELGFAMVSASDNLATKLLPVLENAVNYLAALRHDAKAFREELAQIDPANIGDMVELLEEKIAAIEEASTAVIALRLAFEMLKTGIKTTIEASMLPIKGLAAAMSLLPNVNIDIEKTFRDAASAMLGDGNKVMEMELELLGLQIDQMNMTDEMKDKLKARFGIEQQGVSETINSMEALQAANRKARQEADGIGESFNQAKQDAYELEQRVIALSQSISGELERQRFIDFAIRLTATGVDEQQATDMAKLLVGDLQDLATAGYEAGLAIDQAVRTQALEAFEDFIPIVDEADEGIKDLGENTEESISAISDLATGMANSISSNIGNMLTDFSRLANDTEQAFKDMAEAIIKDLIKIAIRMAIMSVFGLPGGFGQIAGAAMVIPANTGGEIGKIKPQRLAGGGTVADGSDANRDSVLTYLTKGEYVVNRKSTQANSGLLEAINADPFLFSGMQRLNIGGSVGKIPSFNTGGIITSTDTNLGKKLDAIINVLSSKDFAPHIRVENRISATDVNKANRIGERIRGGMDV